MKEKDNKEEIVRQDWKPHWSIGLLHKIWKFVFGAAKIVLGAAATVLLIVVVCGFVLVGILGDYLEEEILPSASLVLENYNMDEPSYVYFVNADGNIEELQRVHASTKWKNAEYEEIPEHLINAAVAIEDKRFYEHQGVDWITTIKAFGNMFLGDETVGGSSITQQLIKNRTKDDSVTVQRKVLEFFRATIVEKNYDKDTIMELYMNSIYLGQGCRGVKSAAETYFGKELRMLSLAECASLISITNNPSLFDPYSKNEFVYDGVVMNGMQRNKHRQKLVLMEMLNQGYITKDEYEVALAQELVLKNGVPEAEKWMECTRETCDYGGLTKTFSKTSGGSAYVCPSCAMVMPIAESNSQVVYTYFVDTVLEDVAKALAERDGISEWNDDIFQNYMELISRSGYRIYSTFDEDVQQDVDNIYQNLHQIPSPSSSRQLQSAIVIIDNDTGDIVAMAGGVGKDKEHFGYNRATNAKLQPGSSIKPLSVYAPGFQQGTLSPATVIKDLPLSTSGGAWPKNDTRTYNYSYVIYDGITKSVNAVAANTLVKIGEQYGFDFLSESFGVDTMNPDKDVSVAALAIGAPYTGVTVRAMANAYATFPNDGIYREARTFTKVYDSNGNLVLDNTQFSEQILSKKTVDYMNYCLVAGTASGTGHEANLAGSYGITTGGKTGTSGSNKDRWYCGFTGYYTAAVWCGFDQPETIYTTNCNNPSAVLFKRVMGPLHKGLENKALYDSGAMRGVSVCLDSGLLATEACKSDVRGESRVRSALVYPGDGPGKSCNKHVQMDYCSGGGVATEFCQHFAEVDTTVKIEKKSLVKLTQKEMNEIKSAMHANLQAMFYQDNYVYFVKDDGSNGSYKGFTGKANAKVDAPYLVCPTHTEEAWKKYQEENPTTPGLPVPTP